MGRGWVAAPGQGPLLRYYAAAIAPLLATARTAT